MLCIQKINEIWTDRIIKMMKISDSLMILVYEIENNYII